MTGDLRRFFSPQSIAIVGASQVSFRLEAVSLSVAREMVEEIAALRACLGYQG